MARDQTQPGSFSRERKEPGNEAGLLPATEKNHVLKSTKRFVSLSIMYNAKANSAK